MFCILASTQLVAEVCLKAEKVPGNVFIIIMCTVYLSNFNNIS